MSKRTGVTSGVVRPIWPSGPDGAPLPVGSDGEPVWPSEQYRRDYEQAVAARSATADARRPSQRTLVIVIAVVLIAAFAIFQIVNYVNAPSQAQKDVCKIYRDNGVQPPPGQTCP